MNAAPPLVDLPPDWDVRRRYVRLTQTHPNGMVTFEFAVGEPGLFVEMVMPRAAFDCFCADQGVVPTHGGLPAPTADRADLAWGWHLRDVRARSGNHPT
ncbi:MAG: phenol hydroxylase subunit [Proteobacteria bacterium]|nr:phenol hydroxylase subunit [Pseudomonadota bacterium]